MANEFYITASCSILDHAVRKDGKVLFRGEAAEPAGFLVACYRYFGFDYPRFYKMDSLAKLGWLSAEVLLKDSFDTNAYQPEETGLILSNANASLDTDIKYLATTEDIASPSVFVYTLPNIMTGEISIRNHFKGENAFFIAEQFDTGFVQQYVSNLLREDLLQACICGWVELLGNEYKAVLFLVEKKQTPGAVLFSAENMNELFYTKEAGNE